MWQLLPLRVRLTLIIAAAIVLGFTGALLSGGLTSSNIALKLLSSVPLLLLIGLVGGSWTKGAWIRACKMGVKNWFPDLNGEWHGVLVSSYQEGGENKEVEISVIIDQRWHSIKITSEVLGGASKSVALHVIPEIRDGGAVLWTHYQQTVAKPELTDTSVFYGSTRMIYDKANDVIDGCHWTNRAWNIGGNTAGSFHLERQPAV